MASLGRLSFICLFLNTEPLLPQVVSRSWDKGPSVRGGPQSETHGPRESN